MKKIWENIIASGISPDRTNLLVLRKFFFINIFSLVGFIFVTGLGLQNLFLEKNYYTGIPELLGGIVFLLTLVFLRISHNLRISQAILLSTHGILLLVILATGGIEQTGIFWYFTFPAAAFFLTGKQNGIIWTLLLYCLTTLVLLLGLLGYTNLAYSLVEVRQLFIVLLALCILIYVYQQVVEKTQDQLEESAIELREYVDNMSTFTAKVAPNGKILFANKVARGASGLEDKLIGANFLTGTWWSFDPEVKQRVAKAFREAVAGNISEYDEKLQIRASNNLLVIIVKLSMIPISKKGKIRYLLIEARDITEEKTLDTAKTEFVTLASHQLRTPISAIAWFTEMLLQGDIGSITPEQKEQLTHIYQSNERMAALVDELLHVSQLETGNFPLKPEAIDLAQTSHSLLIKELQKQSDKQITIQERYDPKLQKVFLDPEVVKIVFQTLFSNALKYTPSKGSVAVTITPSTQDQDIKGVLITVADTGYGIPKGAGVKIFSKLFRAENIKTKDTDGTGLGLYVVKSVLALLGGRIWFTSEENKGSSFFVWVPSMSP